MQASGLNQVFDTQVSAHTGETTNDWYTANQRYLAASLSIVRAHLERLAHQRESEPAEEPARQTLRSIAEAMPGAPALEILCTNFGLSTFERDVLLLCAGMELEAAFAPLYAAAQG